MRKRTMKPAPRVVKIKKDGTIEVEKPKTVHRPASGYNLTPGTPTGSAQ